MLNRRARQPLVPDELESIFVAFAIHDHVHRTAEALLAQSERNS